MTVNLSARQLRCVDLNAQVAAALDAAGLPPELLELELSESALIENINVSARRLGELKASSIRIAVEFQLFLARLPAPAPGIAAGKV